jgi:hypothetical protein
VYVVFSKHKVTREYSQMLYDAATRDYRWANRGTRFPDLTSVQRAVSPIVRNWSSHDRYVPLMHWFEDDTSDADVARATPGSRRT